VNARFRLGELLVQRGLVSAEALEQALSQDSAEPIGERLLRAGHINKRELTLTLRMQRRLRAAAFAAAVTATSVSAGVAVAAPATAQARVQVAATVVGSLRWQASIQTTQAVVTQADVDRGVVTLDNVCIATVQSNGPFHVVFRGSNPHFEEVRVTGLPDGGSVVLQGTEGMVLQRAAPLERRFALGVQLGVRRLAPGTYPLSFFVAIE
jgi:hypothetical protein